MKLAAYLDEIADNPVEAASALDDRFQAICLRRVFSRSICTTYDSAIDMVRNAIGSMEVALICSNVGHTPPEHLFDNSQLEGLDRSLYICQMFNCKYLRLGIGDKSRNQDAKTLVCKWMAFVSEKALLANIVPVFELSIDLAHGQPAELAMLLQKFQRWKIIYDPAALIVRRKLDPYTRYWSLLHKYATHIDLRDHRIGHGAVPLGHGDARIDTVLSDTLNSSYRGYYCLEPAMGRRYKNIVGKQEIFKHNISCLDQLLGRLQMPFKTNEGLKHVKSQ